MDAPEVLLRFLVVLVAARVAAEAAERLGQPAVLAEILAGVVIGPSVLRLVGHDEVLAVLGEIGAILLLFEVGMQMDPSDLRRVGGDALRVALIGVVVPMTAGLAVLRGLGIPDTPALFVAAGLTATSVGITARVFADLRVLASPEARTVLGAAIADDVAGLLILTVVAGIAAGGSVQIASVASVTAGALAFVVVAGAAGLALGPRFLRAVAERARTEGALLAAGFALALMFALLAAGARLAPIVGAFLAGLALSRSEARDDLRRRLSPVGHLLIPVFFLQIGIGMRLQVFGHRRLLGAAALITVVAVAGKVAAGLGAGRGRANRLLVGVAMVPRGEVGLIFAGLGLSQGVLDASLYALLVFVVLVTTFVTPPLLRLLVHRARRAAQAPGAGAPEPPGGWLRFGSGGVELAAEPPAALVHRVGLEAALACAAGSPGPLLLDWLSRTEAWSATPDSILRARFFALLRHGNERSWRFLEVSGLLALLLPELDESIRRRRNDPFDLDPAAPLRWSALSALNALVDDDAGPAGRIWGNLSVQEPVLLAALAQDAFEGREDAPALASRVAASLGLERSEIDAVAFLVSERRLLETVASHPDAGTEDSVLELAAHLGTRERADASYLLTLSRHEEDGWHRRRIDELYRLVRGALAHPDLTGPAASDLIEARREGAVRALPDLPEELVQRHLAEAPRRYLLAHSPKTIGRHVRMTGTRPARSEVRLEAEPAGGEGEWLVHVALLDRPGLLASLAGALEAAGIAVVGAFVFTWRSGLALDTFRVIAPKAVDWERVRRTIREAVARGVPNGSAPGAAGGEVEIDNAASPWHTLVRVRSQRPDGLLSRSAWALARAGAQVHTAAVGGEGAVASFHVTDRTGGKLDGVAERHLRLLLAGEPPLRRRGPGRARPDPSSAGHE